MSKAIDTLRVHARLGTATDDELEVLAEVDRLRAALMEFARLESNCADPEARDQIAELRGLAIAALGEGGMP